MTESSAEPAEAPAPPAKPHPLESTLAALVGLLLIGLTVGLLYVFAQRWAPVSLGLPDRSVEIMLASVAGFVGVLAFFFGLSGALQRRIWLALGSPARGQPGGLRGMGAVAGGLGAALGGALLVLAAGQVILPDLALPVNALAAGLAGVVALGLAWLVALGLRLLGY
ncbi:MAG: hypothetical protein IT317_22660 [Anaerolineales bacterium]|nr:hypothetical protein [Anaerolineales bacterium]